MTSSPSVPRVLLFTGLLALAGWSQARTWSMVLEPRVERGGAPGPGQDFYQFRWVPTAFRDYGVEDFYRRPQRKRMGQLSLQRVREERTSAVERRAARQNRETYEGGMGAAGTPFFYAAFGATRTDFYDRDLVRFRVTCLAVSELAVLALCLGLSYSWWRVLLVFVLCSHWFRPYAGLLTVANVNHLQLGLVVLTAVGVAGLGRRAGPLAVGAILGFGLLFKPNPAFGITLLFLGWLARRELGRVVIGTLAGFATAAVGVAWSSAWFGGLGIWNAWMNRTSRALTSFSGWNKAPVAWIQKMTDVNVEPVLLGGLMLAAILLILRRQGLVRSSPDTRRASFHRAVLTMGVGLVIPLVGFRVVWDHHYTLAIPLMLYLARPGRAGGGVRRQALVGVAAVLLAGIPQQAGWPISDGLDTILLACAGCLLVGAGFVELARPWTGPPAEVGAAATAT